MKQVRVGCIVATFAPNGKVSSYRLTLPVPYDYVIIHGMVDMVIKPNNKGTMRYFYCPENEVFEVVEQKKFAAQILVNEIKKERLEQRGHYLLSQLTQCIV